MDSFAESRFISPYVRPLARRFVTGAHQNVTRSVVEKRLLIGHASW